MRVRHPPTLPGKDLMTLFGFWHSETGSTLGLPEWVLGDYEVYKEKTT